MSTTFATLSSVLTAAAVSAVVVTAQQPRIGNGRVMPQPATALAQTFRAAVGAVSDIGWIGYAVPVVDGERVMCCFNAGSGWIQGSAVMSDRSACCGMCGLEPLSAATGQPSKPSSAAPAPIKLEGSDSMVVMFRVAGKQVERVRVFSDDCELDAGGRDVVWLTGVNPADSIALLESLIAAQPERRDRVADGAVNAIALHRDAAADAALERLLAAAQPQAIRAKVPFWLGNTRGRRGVELLQRVIKDDASQDVRKKAVFGLSQSSEPNALDILLDHARNNPDASVRSESIFWLAQKAGSKAAGAITERIEQDPDTEVKKRAVFALSQLPKDQGVPLLLQVARTHSNPAVRKQAIFWLGQSRDPRALDFFAEVLK